jgi:carbamoyl-phosphate synthase large subunit
MAVMAIKALRQDKEIKIIAADSNTLAPGLYLSHKGVMLPSFDDKCFFEKLIELTKKENINVIMPSLDTILLAFSEKAEEFKELGVKILVSDPETIRITRDKWQTYARLKDVIPYAKSFNDIREIDIDFPLFIKPREGSGSKDAYKVNSKIELDFYWHHIRNAVIQEYLCGDEYTVDCLADMEGNLVACVPRKRIEIRDGISTKSLIVQDENLEKLAKLLAGHLAFKGPFFFQAKKDSYGSSKVIEVNARIAGTMCPSSFSESNFHILGVRLAMGEKIQPPKVKYGVYLTRYWEEIYISETEIQSKFDYSYLNVSSLL